LVALVGAHDSNCGLGAWPTWRRYRAPELLFGAKFYSSAIDVWSVGCIFAELLLRVPYFPGNTDIEQLCRIFTARGTPTDETWPGVSDLPDYIAFQPQKPQPLRDIFTAASDDAIALLERCLALNPAERISAQAALEHAYFAAAPPPASHADLAPPAREPEADASDRPAKRHKPAEAQ
jgi:cyclin-dependent kinase 7